MPSCFQKKSLIRSPLFMFLFKGANTMKKGLITLTLAILPVFGFANTNLASLISQNPLNTNDTCTIQYNANHDKAQFCTCYGNELHDNDRFNPKRPAHQ